jgi:predicted DNA-binding antitoxin AbrB/MazE fold protein
MAQVVDAVYESGVFRPLEPVACVEGQRVRLAVNPGNGRPAPEEMLSLARKVYEGLSEAEVEAIEAIALDRSNFIPDRANK